jgi:hypothetical protein
MADDFRKRPLPRWAGLVLGPLICMYAAARFAGPGAGLPLAESLGLGAAMGFLVGLIVFLLDPRSAKAPRPKAVDPFQDADRQLRGLPPAVEATLVPVDPTPLIGRLLAILGIGLFCMPVLGMVLASIAWLINRRASRGWRVASIVGFVLATVVNMYVVAIIASH